jgi:hypothetical protein
VRCIGGQKYTANSHLLHTSVVDIIQIGLLDPILIRRRMPGKYLLKMPVSAFEEFFISEVAGVAVRYSPEAAFASFCYQAPVLGVDHVVSAIPSMFLEAVVEYLG